jgi:hypothetical protein
MKIIKTKKVILVQLTMIILVCIFPVLQSCSSSDESMQIQSSKNTSLEYLDVDVSNLQNATNEQKQILQKAIKRIDPYVIYGTKTCSLTISSGSEIQISDRLFEFFKTSTNNMNSFLKNTNIVSDKNDSKKFRILTPTKLNSNVRMKVGAVEGNINVNSSTVTMSLTTVNVYVSNDLLSQITGGGALSAGSAFYEELGELGMALTFASTISGYVASQNPNGIIVHYSGSFPFYWIDGIYSQSTNNNNYFR